MATDGVVHFNEPTTHPMFSTGTIDNVSNGNNMKKNSSVSNGCSSSSA
jgi:hypothetical protein